MSEIAIGAGASSARSFTRRTALVIVAVGVAAFIAMLVLGAYAPDLRSGKNGGAHALSNAATGFSGLVRLAEATGRNPQVVRNAGMLDSEDLLVVTPEEGRKDLSEVLAEREARVTLVVLPKWNTIADPKKTGWVRVDGIRPTFDTEQTLAPANPFSIQVAKSTGMLRTVAPAAPADLTFKAPPQLQSLSGKQWRPVITDAQGRMVLAQWTDQPLFVLADPDLLNNHGVKDAGQARAALALIDFLNRTDADGVLFDVTANGLGASRSPLKLAFEPPFLGVTLAIAAALLLAGLQALTRFGPPRRPERAIRFGKAALVDNSAALVRRAGRETHFGDRYASVVRSLAARLLRLPPSLSEQEVEERLDRARAAGPPFHALAAQAAHARTRDELTDAARGLHRWLKELKA